MCMDKKNGGHFRNHAATPLLNLVVYVIWDMMSEHILLATLIVD